jgi:ABC-type cobalamin/Fe3+-siderophores transport system ATPase subunit
MISDFRLKFGHSSEAAAESISTTPITVFVGPNNSGKSKILSEIEHRCRTGQKIATDVILDDLVLVGLTGKKLDDVIEQLKQPPNPGEIVYPGNMILGSRYGRVSAPPNDLRSIAAAPISNPTAFCQWILTHFTLMLDGRSRINLVAQQGAGDLQRPPHTSLQVLFRDDKKRGEVRHIIQEAFGTHFVIDPTALGTLRIRLSNRPPNDPFEERGIHHEAVQFHEKAQPIDETSDGVKAFVGIVSELIAGDPKVVLIDEPEAFLHPSLAFKLGLEVARAAVETDKRVFASTHSPQFVMGCIQSGAPVNIIRLTYRGANATARSLPSDELLSLMRNPLLRSTGVVGGLFYEFVVVAESDADRAFYQEANERLPRFKPEWGIPNCLFINAQNKQTIKTVLQPLRKLGIPTAGIVDVDVLKEGGAVWTGLLESAHIPEITRNSLASARAAVKRAMEQTGLDMKRDGGLSILSGEQNEAARTLLDQLGEYGVFVVPGGELESWLKTLGCPGHGPQWLIKVFEAMGDEPNDANYVRPSDDDVWKFLTLIRAWLVKPDRKGLPA